MGLKHLQNGIRDIKPKEVLQVTAVREDKTECTFEVTARLDTVIDLDYFKTVAFFPILLRKIICLGSVKY